MAWNESRGIEVYGMERNPLFEGTKGEEGSSASM